MLCFQIVVDTMTFVLNLSMMAVTIGLVVTSPTSVSKKDEKEAKRDSKCWHYCLMFLFCLLLLCVYIVFARISLDLLGIPLFSGPID